MGASYFVAAKILPRASLTQSSVVAISLTS